MRKTTFIVIGLFWTEMAEQIAHDLRLSVQNRYSIWKSEEWLAVRVNDSIPEQTLPIVKAAVANIQNKRPLLLGLISC